MISTKTKSFLFLSLSAVFFLTGCGVQQTVSYPNLAVPAPVTTSPSTPVAPATSETIQTQSITISNFTFSPSTLEVAAGTTVTWTNNDSAPHTIVTADKLISSPTLKTSESFTFKFDTAGTYSYSCGIHPSMKGEVIVK